MHFFPSSLRWNAIVPAAFAMGLVRAVLSILLVGENVASAAPPRGRVRTADWVSPAEDSEEELEETYFEEDDFVDDVEPGPSLGLMRSTNARSVLVARGKRQAGSSSDEDEGVFKDDDAESLPPAKGTRQAPRQAPSRSLKQAPTRRPVPPGSAESHKQYLSAEDEASEEYDDPTCAAEPSNHKRHHGQGYLGHHDPHEPLFPPSKWRIHTSPMFAHNDPADPMRHHGWGDPLYGSSWRNRPWYLSPFVGGLIGDDIEEDRIRQGGNFFAGLRLGCDFDHYFGAETRVGFSDLSLSYPLAGFSTGKSSNVAMFDGSLLYYPLGDTRWRPYLTTGIGIASFHYFDEVGNKFRASALTLPFGAGLKVKIRPAIALRFDIVDNFATGTGGLLDAMHNVSFTGGFEWHFGGRTTNYYPW